MYEEDVDGQEPEKVLRFEDTKEGWSAFLVIDSFVKGAAAGGVRIAPGLALAEVKILAREMTKKFLFTGLPSRGGAKGGISLSEDHIDNNEKRRKILIQFGEMIGRLVREGRYLPAVDMGTTDQDMEYMIQGTGLPSGAAKPKAAPDSGLFTALTAFSSVKAWAEYTDIPLSGLKVAMEGFGKVGSHLALLLDRAGCKIIAVSTRHAAVVNRRGLDISRLRNLRDLHSDRFLDHYGEGEQINPRELLTLDTDLLIPGAAVETIDGDNAIHVKAHAVIPVANAPFSREGEEILQERGIFFLPGYVCNCGGILGSHLAILGFGNSEIEQIVSEDFNERMRRILMRSRESGVTPVAVAQQDILKRAKTWTRSRDYDLIRVLSGLSRRGMFPLGLSKFFMKSSIRKIITASSISS